MESCALLAEVIPAVATAVEGKAQGMRITLQNPKEQNSVSVYTVTSKSGVLTETLFLLLMVSGEEKFKKKSKTNQPQTPPTSNLK